MRILLINPPHTAIGSRIPIEHLPPLGLLSIGGPLIDDGHEVQLLDAEFGPLPLEEIVAQAKAFDPDLVQVMYVTPHRWTPFFRLTAERRVIQTDRKKWDYKHQVLATRHMAPWRVILWVKFIECVMQLRPRALWRLMAHPDKGIRAGHQWYYRVGRRVLWHEIANFLFRESPYHLKNGPTLAQFWGAPQDAEENSMQRRPLRALRVLNV